MPAVINDGGSQAQRVYIHDIDMFVNHLYNQGIRFDTAGCSGVIEGLRVSNAELLAGGEFMRLDGSGAEPGWTVRDSTIRTSRNGVVVEAGDVSIDGIEFINCDTAIEFTSDLGGRGVIGNNVYRDVTTPFTDADITVTGTKFADIRTAVWDTPGDLEVGAGTARFYLQRRTFIIAASLAADTAGTGSGSNIIDVNLNGTTLYPTQGNRPTLTATENNSGLQGCGSMAAVGDYLTVDVDAVTATTPASAVVATVFYVEMPAS